MEELSVWELFKRYKDAEKILDSIQSDSNPTYLLKLVEEYKEKHRKENK